MVRYRNMLPLKSFHNEEKGFVLLGMLFIMVLMAVTALGMNRRAAMQARMAANQTHAVQTYLGQVAAIEKAIWQLTKDPCWRTSTSGEDYTYNGINYNRKVLNSLLSGFTDAITVSVTAPGGLKPIRTSFRYWIFPPFLGMDFPGLLQVCPDSWDNIYVADKNNHTIYKRDAITGEVTKVAGSGSSGYSGDGGPATAARLNSPWGVAVDGEGKLYIADTLNHCIRKVDASTGIITTVAGTGIEGYSGDGGPATSAELNHPKGVHVDASGNIYIADTLNHCIRKVDASNGYIATIAGTGTAGDSGVGDAATEATLRYPWGVFVDGSGDIYIADTLNHKIKKVDAVDGIISKVAGLAWKGHGADGQLAILCALDTPMGVYVDTSGNIYIADTANNEIREVYASTGRIYTIAGSFSAGYSGDGGPATSAELDHPIGICLNSTGEVIISDTLNSCLRHVDLSGMISTLCGAGFALDNPTGIALDISGNLYIADMGNNRVLALYTSGEVATVAGTGAAGYGGDGGSATEAQLNRPTGVALDASGNIYIGDSSNHCIRKVDISGNITTVAGTGVPGYSGDGGPATEAQLEAPRGVALDASGNLYIADTKNECIRKVDTSGIITRVAGMGDKGGWSGDGGPATASKLLGPSYVFVDATGNIYIADTLNNRIRKVDAATGSIDTLAGTGVPGDSGDGGPAINAQLNKPISVFVDSEGNMFIADKDNHRIRAVSAHDGVINTLAGTGIAGFNGNFQPAVMAQLQPTCVAMAATRGGSKIYISDTFNNRVRMLNFKMVRKLH